MNYAYLASKYAQLDSIVEDRTYDGLHVLNGQKPPLAVFEAWQQLENQEAQSGQHKDNLKDQEMERRHQAARHRALQDITPFEDLAKASADEAYQAAITLRKEAIQCQQTARVKEGLESAWIEIQKAQDLINQEAQGYLDSTAFVLSWDPAAVPADIAGKRRDAQARIVLGQTVYRDWIHFRSKEMPSQQEIHEALQKGGEHVERIRALAKAAVARYPRPKIY